jgi:hypothetical protein
MQAARFDLRNQQISAVDVETAVSAPIGSHCPDPRSPSRLCLSYVSSQTDNRPAQAPYLRPELVRSPACLHARYTPIVNQLICSQAPAGQ